ncbi:hypothetical protein VPH35_005905 [Triticum aestivum]
MAILPGPGAASPNLLVVTGCNVQATLLTRARGKANVATGCTTYCPLDAPLREEDVDNDPQVGYCSVPITTHQTYYDVELKRLGNGSATINNDVPVYVLIAHSDWFNLGVAIVLMNLDKPGPKQQEDHLNLMEIPVFMEWKIFVYGSRHDAPVSANTNCTMEGQGDLYWCHCEPGYEGNPYLDGGCQDINECLDPGGNGCFGECTNREGYFDCGCHRGFEGNANVPYGCVKTKTNTGLIIGLSVSVVPCVMFLVLGGIFMIRKLKNYRAKRMKQKFFNQNRDQLLQQLVSQRSDIGERMIIPLKDLEKATNNFDETRKLGGGGHGTVYKGILSDLHVVAIKKSNIVVQREIDEFINEVAILSHINHRNVVKLHGCCLETEVPMLAYEFISNGTLCEHLHHGSPRSIPWGDRLRIANEVGKAIAYLHSAVSIPIIHRDIKSSNILLDDALTAKVSDFGASRYIPIDEVGATTTAVQGTIGYLDPMYYYTGRLSEKSDVYSFGVLLVELLTRKMPVKYRSSKGDGLVVEFVELLEQDNLVSILDPQIVEEGGAEIKDVSALAASCIQLKGEERPTMRQVGMALEGLQSTKDHAPYDMQPGRNDDSYTTISYPSTKISTSLGDVSRQYSQEEEFSLSARYPR